MVIFIVPKLLDLCFMREEFLVSVEKLEISSINPFHSSKYQLGAERFKFQGPFARSSGWGKSFMVCSLRNSGVFVIYCSFMREGSTGYPPRLTAVEWCEQQLLFSEIHKSILEGKLDVTEHENLFKHRKLLTSKLTGDMKVEILSNTVGSTVLTLPNWNMHIQKSSGMTLRSIDLNHANAISKGMELGKTAPEAAGFDMSECESTTEKALPAWSSSSNNSISSSVDLRTTATFVDVLGSFMSHVKNSYIQARNSALDLHHPASDFWVAAVALPSAVVGTAVPFINLQIKLFKNLTSFQQWKTMMLCVSNYILSVASYSAVLAMIPAEIQKAERKFATWGLLADQVPITRQGLNLILAWSSTVIHVPLVACITFYRCKQVFSRRWLLKKRVRRANSGTHPSHICPCILVDITPEIDRLLVSLGGGHCCEAYKQDRCLYSSDDALKLVVPAHCRAIEILDNILHKCRLFEILLSFFFLLDMSKLYQALASATTVSFRSCSSGSQHDETASSLFLNRIVDEFLEEEADGGSIDHQDHTVAAGENHHEDHSNADPEELKLPELENLLVKQNDGEIELLAADARRSRDQAAKLNLQGAALQRSVMSKLRGMGYNAAVCKSRWKATRTIPEGHYSFIDVLLHPRKRVFIDTEFSMQFVIARPSQSYAATLSKVPRLFIGTSETLHRLILLTSRAMKQSLKSQGLAIPPWRQEDYLKAKWFSTYRRTTNPKFAAQEHMHEFPDFEQFMAVSTKIRKPSGSPRRSGLSALAAAGLIHHEDENSRGHCSRCDQKPSKGIGETPLERFTDAFQELQETTENLSQKAILETQSMIKDSPYSKASRCALLKKELDRHLEGENELADSSKRQRDDAQGQLENISRQREDFQDRPPRHGFCKRTEELMEKKPATDEAAVGVAILEEVDNCNERPPVLLCFSQDGYAVVSSDDSGDYPVVAPGRGGHHHKIWDCCFLLCGKRPVPRGADTVVLENTCIFSFDGHKKFASCPVLAKAKIYACGFDIAKRDKVLSAVAEIASVGTTKVKVFPRPTVILSTGDELIDYSGNSLQRGQIRDSNRPMLVTAVRSHQWKPLTFATLAAPGSNKKMLVFGLPRNPVSGMVTFDLITLSLAKFKLEHVSQSSLIQRGQNIIALFYNGRTLRFSRESTGRQASGCLLVCANTLLELPKGPGVLTAGSLVSNRDITSKSKPVKTPDPTKPGIKKSILIINVLIVTPISKHFLYFWVFERPARPFNTGALEERGWIINMPGNPNAVQVPALPHR
ncbi:hypothetical protein SELMODRAFT_428171 [Selaginella moellendorffii]|uniref:Uncharacterized protein n=1 Tax=Selaginella moellendorffii TaxID=88036 RepID=D8T1Z5_SELML|nr:hypothetical protein SELMODRAFT_428171 [Selaginella moellendorffii]